MLEISRRLEVIASMISPGNILADVGTDHAYIPIYQVQGNKCPRAIAMDLREGPLERAKEHIQRYGLSSKIETRLSDGVEALAVGEVQTIVIAGMGGGLVKQILSRGKAVCKAAEELILQPQSEIDEVRCFLREQGYVILAEEMVEEDGKYYPMMRATACKEKATGTCADAGKLQILEDLYGPLLLVGQNAVLAQFLRKQEQQYRQILDGLKVQKQSEKIVTRTGELEQKLEYNLAAQHIMGMK